MRFLRKYRPSPALVVAGAALLVALGGTSVAAVSQLPRGSVGTPQLKSNAVTTPKIKNNAVNASKIARQRGRRGEDCEQRGRDSEDRGQRGHECEDRKRHDPAGRPLGGCQDVRPAGRRRGAAGATGPTGAGRAEQRVRAVRQRPNCHSQHTDHARESVHTGSGRLRHLGQGGGRDAATSLVGATVTCTLEAGADVDQSAVTVLSDSLASLPLQVVHQFTAAGTVNFRCAADDDASAGAIKITAIRVGSLVNTG